MSEHTQEAISELIARLEIMRVGGPTADGTIYLHGRMSNEQWILLNRLLATLDVRRFPTSGKVEYMGVVDE